MENWVRPPDVGYGVPGAVALDAHRKIELARQKSAPKLSVASTRHLCAPIMPNQLTSEFNVMKTDSQVAFMNIEALGGVDASMVRTMANESLILESPSVHDPVMGQRVLVDEHHQVFYGDDQYIRKVENDQIVANFDLKSPVLQVDSFLCRTRKGIAYFDASHLPTRKLTQPVYLIDGNFMHLAPFCSSNDNFVDQMLTTDRQGMLKLWDIESLACRQELTLPRGNLTGWSRTWQLEENPSNILWCNVYEMSQIDMRSNDRKTDRSIIRFEDKQQEIKACCHDSNGNVFVLTSYHLYWISSDIAQDSNNPEIVLTLEQPLAALDYSISLSHTYFETRNGPPLQLVTASSQLSSDIMCWTLGTSSDGRPCSLQDQYTIDLWPNTIPQSHEAIQNGPNSLSAYYVSENNGLFSQILELGGADSDTNDDLVNSHNSTGNLPFSEVTNTSRAQELPPYCKELVPPDFNFQDQDFGCDFYNFSMYYKHAFQDPLDRKLDPPRQNPTESAAQDSAVREGKFELLGFENREAFTQYCMDMWSKPLITRGDSARSVAYRQKQIQRVISDMAECTANFGNEPTGSERLVNPKSMNRTVQQVVAKWHTEEEQEEEKREEEEESQSQSQSQTQAMSQTQYESQSQTQSQFPTLSQSQPVLGLPKKKSTKKKSKKRKRL